jgi:glycerol-3-phosphate acyltransferase PlsX
MIKIGFDLMGSEIGPEIAYESSIEFIKNNPDVEIILYTVKNIFDPIITNPRITLKYGDDFINNTDTVMQSARKKNSTLNVMLNDLSANLIQGCGTAAPSGPLVLNSYKIIGALPNVKPAFAPIFYKPNKEYSIVLDVGANIEYTADDIVR